MSNEFGFKSLFNKIDIILIISAVILTVLGIVLIRSATLFDSNADVYLIKQLSALGIGIAVFFVLALLPYSIFRSYGVLMYIISIGLLVFVLFFGRTFNGTRGWLSFGTFYFQPVELVKLLFILILASYLDRRKTEEIQEWATVLVTGFLMGVLTFLLLLQPDFSSSVVFFPIYLGMLFFAGVPTGKIFTVLFFVSTSMVIPLFDCWLMLQKSLVAKSWILKFVYASLHQFWPAVLMLVLIFALLVLIKQLLDFLSVRFSWQRFVFIYLLILLSVGASFFVRVALKDYQRLRLISFINPALDPLGAGYNIIQSKIAIGSGRVIGKGLFNSTQGRLGFVPAQRTDFIFSVMGEELGFLGSIMVVVLISILLFRIVLIIRDARDRYGQYVSMGLLCMFSFYFFANLGMTMGIMPVIGVYLPFISYGGSALVGAYMALGLLISIQLRQYGY
ncbi:MAG: rod shape-determining protein RodA [Elusimicrobiota bacterium]